MIPLSLTSAVDAGPSALLRPGEVEETRAMRGLETLVLASLPEVQALEKDWRALEAAAPAPVVYQSFAQISTWIRHFDPDMSRTRIVVVRSAGRTALILPIVTAGRALFRTARIAGDPIAQYAEILANPATDLRAAFAAALDALAAGGIHTLVLRRVRDDSLLRAAAGDRLGTPLAPNAAPFADLTPYPDYQAFLNSLSKNMRKGLRNRRHHIERAGAVTFECLEGGAAARGALEDAIDLKRQWLIQRGAVSSAFLDPHTRDCLLDLAGDHSAAGAIVMRLSVDGEPAAIRFGFEYRNTYYAYLSAYNAEYADLSPGKMLMDAYLAEFPARRIERLDMMAPIDRHKTDWCAGLVPLADYSIPLGLRGRVHSEIVQKRLLPAMRRGWRSMPPRLRKAAARLFLNL